MGETNTYKSSTLGFRTREPVTSDRVTGDPARWAGIVRIATGEFGRLTHNALDGLRLTAVHPTYLDARRAEAASLLGEHATSDEIDQLLAEET